MIECNYYGPFNMTKYFIQMKDVQLKKKKIKNDYTICVIKLIENTIKPYL